MGKAEQEHLARVRALTCIVCRRLGLGKTPASAHHINCKAMGKKASDYETIPLCPIHHQYGDGTRTFKGQIAVHKNKTEFERRYGTEQSLLAQTLKELENVGE